MEAESVLAGIVGRSYPEAVDLGSGWLRRDWVVRTIRHVPDTEAIRLLGAQLGDDVFADLVQAYGHFASTEQLERVRPEYALARMDDIHLVARVTFAGRERSLGDEGAISQFGLLRRIDRLVGIDDLQGIPRGMWFFLQGDR